MLSSFIIIFRECFEAAIVVGTILMTLKNTNKYFLAKYVYTGSLLGASASFLCGLALFNTIKQLDPIVQRYFEGCIMLFVAGLIAYFIVWLEVTNRKVTKELKKVSFTNTSIFALIVIPLLTVFREGIEVILFLVPLFKIETFSILIGGILGISLAIVATIIVFKATVKIKININILFKILNILFIFIGALMFGEGLAEFLPDKAESVETAGMLLYAIPCLYFFLKGYIKSYIKNLSNKQINK